jgi:hypothetical protein
MAFLQLGARHEDTGAKVEKYTERITFPISHTLFGCGMRITSQMQTTELHGTSWWRLFTFQD